MKFSNLFISQNRDMTDEQLKLVPSFELFFKLTKKYVAEKKVLRESMKKLMDS